MVWLALAQVVSFVVDLALIAGPRDDRDKELELLLPRHQVRLLQRRQPRAPRLSRWEKLTVAILAAKLAQRTDGPGRRLDQLVLLFRPETGLKWHRELVRRTWTFARRRAGGRPPGPAELEAQIVRLAGEDRLAVPAIARIVREDEQTVCRWLKRWLAEASEMRIARVRFDVARSLSSRRSSADRPSTKLVTGRRVTSMASF